MLAAGAGDMRQRDREAVRLTLSAGQRSLISLERTMPSTVSSFLSFPPSTVDAAADLGLEDRAAL